MYVVQITLKNVSIIFLVWLCGMCTSSVLEVLIWAHSLKIWFCAQQFYRLGSTLALKNENLLSIRLFLFGEEVTKLSSTAVWKQLVSPLFIRTWVAYGSLFCCLVNSLYGGCESLNKHVIRRNTYLQILKHEYIVLYEWWIVSSWEPV